MKTEVRNALAPQTAFLIAMTIYCMAMWGVAAALAADVPHEIRHVAGDTFHFSINLIVVTRGIPFDHRTSMFDVEGELAIVRLKGAGRDRDGLAVETKNVHVSASTTGETTEAEAQKRSLARYFEGWIIAIPANGGQNPPMSRAIVHDPYKHAIYELLMPEVPAANTRVVTGQTWVLAGGASIIGGTGKKEARPVVETCFGTMVGETSGRETGSAPFRNEAAVVKYEYYGGNMHDSVHQISYVDGAQHRVCAGSSVRWTDLGAVASLKVFKIEATNVAQMASTAPTPHPANTVAPGAPAPSN